MFRSEKPITAVTVLIERLTKEEYDVDDLSDLPTLIEAIRLQRATGPTEAARAIRKKLKYGNPHRQLRALVILDDLIQNAGPAFQKQFADEPLLERLRFIVNDPITDSDVKVKCNALYRQWAVSYKNTPGMHNVAVLYKQLPQRKRAPNKETSKVLRETERPEDEDEEDAHQGGVSSPTAESSTLAERRRSSAVEYHTAASQLTFAPAGYQPSRGGTVLPQPMNNANKSKRDRKGSKSKVKPFNFEKERPQITHVITMANIEATGLLNAMKLIDKDKIRVSENVNVKRRFETCKQLRRQTFRYCSLVTDESYLGTLLNANDQLSDALILYEQLDRAFDYDSDSEDYDDPAGAGARTSSPTSPPVQRMRGLSLKDAMPPEMPQRPPVNPSFTLTSPSSGKAKEKERELPPEEEEDEDDPFADRNEVSTPYNEKEGINWKDV